MAFPDPPTIISPATTCIACNAPHDLLAANRDLSAKLFGARSILQETLELLTNQVPPIMPGLRHKIALALELTKT